MLDKTKIFNLKSLFLLLQFIIVSSLQAQDAYKCIQDTSFAMSYSYPEEQIIFHFGTIATADNGTLIISQCRSRATGNKGILISKVDKKGTPVWSKKIEAQFANIAAMVPTTNGYVFALNGFKQAGSESPYLFFFA